MENKSKLISKKRATIKEVSKKSGLSIGTVSRFISNSGYVGKDSRELIKKAIKELNYIPNAAARSIINKKSRIVGVTVPEINNPFLADLVVKIEECLSERNYSIMLCNTRYNLKKTENFINDLIMRNAEGIMLVSTDFPEDLAKKVLRYMHGVVTGQKLCNFDCINYADFACAYQITEYLIKNGHKEIACIGYNKNAGPTMNRLYGLQAALRDNLLPVKNEYMLEYRGGDNGGFICTEKLMQLPERPTAIFAINDFYAFGAYEAIYKYGLRVGKDVSVVGFDDISLAKFISPSLTTVHCDTHIMAKTATDLLMDKINNTAERIEFNDFMLESSIIYRDSVCKISDKAVSEYLAGTKVHHTQRVLTK